LVFSPCTIPSPVHPTVFAMKPWTMLPLLSSPRNSAHLSIPVVPPILTDFQPEPGKVSFAVSDFSPSPPFFAYGSPALFKRPFPSPPLKDRPVPKSLLPPPRSSCLGDILPAFPFLEGPVLDFPSCAPPFPIGLKTGSFFSLLWEVFPQVLPSTSLPSGGGPYLLLFFFLYLLSPSVRGLSSGRSTFSQRSRRSLFLIAGEPSLSLLVIDPEGFYCPLLFSEGGILRSLLHAFQVFSLRSEVPSSYQ